MSDPTLTAILTLLEENKDSITIKVHVGTKLHDNYIVFGLIPDTMVTLVRDPADPDKIHCYNLDPNSIGTKNGVTQATYVRGVHCVVSVWSLNQNQKS